MTNPPDDQTFSPDAGAQVPPPDAAPPVESLSDNPTPISDLLDNSFSTEESAEATPTFIVPTSPNLSRSKSDLVDAPADPIAPVSSDARVDSDAPLRPEAPIRRAPSRADNGKRKKLIAALAGVVVLGGGAAAAVVFWPSGNVTPGGGGGGGGVSPPKSGDVANANQGGDAKPDAGGAAGGGASGVQADSAPRNASQSVAKLVQSDVNELKVLQPGTPEFDNSSLALAFKELDSGALSAEDRQKLLTWMRDKQAELSGTFAGSIVKLIVGKYGVGAPSGAGAATSPRRSGAGGFSAPLLGVSPGMGRGELVRFLGVSWLQAGDDATQKPAAAANADDLDVKAAEWLFKNSKSPSQWQPVVEQVKLDKLKADFQKQIDGLQKQVEAAQAAAKTASDLAGMADTKATSASDSLATIGELKLADLKAALTSLDARTKLDEFKPDALGGDVAESARAEFKTLWDDADALAKALQDKIDNPSESWPAAEAAPIRAQLQRLQAGLVQLQLRRVTLAAAGPKSAPWSIDPLKKLGSGLHARFVKLKEQEQAVDKELEELRKLASEMAGKTVAPDEGAALLARMQELLQIATQFELELAAKKQVPSMVKLAYGKQRFDSIAALVDLKPEAVDALKPSVDSSDELKKLWDEYKKAVDEWRATPPAGPLTPEEDAKLAARLESALYAKLRLETAKSLADIAAATPTAPNSGQPGQTVPANAVLRPEYQRKVTEINVELTKLQKSIVATNAALTEQSQAREALSRRIDDVVASNVGIEKKVAESVAKDLKALSGRVDQLVLKPDGVSQAQIAQITSQSTKDVLAQLAEWGYLPQPGNGPPPGSASAGAVDPSSARETAAQGYSQFYVGETEHLHRALKLFGHACQQDPTHPTYRYFLGLTLFRLGRVPEAETQIRAGRGLERNREHLHINGDLQRVQGPMREWFENVRFGG